MEIDTDVVHEMIYNNDWTNQKKKKRDAKRVDTIERKKIIILFLYKSGITVRTTRWQRHVHTMTSRLWVYV